MVKLAISQIFIFQLGIISLYSGMTKVNNYLYIPRGRHIVHGAYYTFSIYHATVYENYNHADKYKQIWAMTSDIPFLSQNAVSLQIYHSLLVNHSWKLHRVQSLGCEHSLNDNACLMVCESPASRKDLLYGALQEKLKRGIQSAIRNVVVCQKIFKDLICI